MSNKKISKQIIGRAEWVHFPQWELYNLNAKVDTGAYTSSLHAHHISVVEEGPPPVVRFYLLDPQHSAYNNRQLKMPVKQQRLVKSSNGTAERRFIIETTITIMGEQLPVELSLTDRSEMKYPVLLGRKILTGRYIVDVDTIHCSKKYKNKS